MAKCLRLLGISFSTVKLIFIDHLHLLNPGAKDREVEFYLSLCTYLQSQSQPEKAIEYGKRFYARPGVNQNLLVTRSTKWDDSREIYFRASEVKEQPLGPTHPETLQPLRGPR